jgi:branched-chain amino acid transport system ATP-binding protein
MGATTARTADTRTPALLEVNDLHVKYGAIRAVRGASFSVAEGELAVLIGANGAGKSTILNTLSGVLRPHAGAATFDGLDLTRAPSAAIVRHGLVQVPEGREILARLTVRENLELASRARTGDDVAAMFERFPALAERADVAAGQLSGGEQQQLAIARALVARPRLLLLDEPSLGLAPQTAERVFREIEQIHAQGITVLLVEQNAAWALDLADRAFVLESGRIGLAGTGQELRDHPDVRRAYLGS